MYAINTAKSLFVFFSSMPLAIKYNVKEDAFLLVSSLC